MPVTVSHPSSSFPPPPATAVACYSCGCRAAPALPQPSQNSNCQRKARKTTRCFFWKPTLGGKKKYYPAPYSRSASQCARRPPTLLTVRGSNTNFSTTLYMSMFSTIVPSNLSPSWECGREQVEKLGVKKVRPGFCTKRKKRKVIMLKLV